MKQNHLIIGSILTSCILILVSFSSVVSINTIEQSNNPSTPLFDTRINSALQSESTTPLSTSYIGKDVFNDMWFPKTTHTGLLLQKAHSIAHNLQNYLKNIKDIRSLSDNEIVSLMISYLKNQDIFSNMNEGYLHVLLSRHLQSNQHFEKSIIDEHSTPINLFTYNELCEFIYLLLIFIVVPFLLLLGFLFPNPDLKCGEL